MAALMKSTFLTTHSSSRTLRSCPQRYLKEYEQGLRPIREADALRVGSSYHLCREYDDDPEAGVWELMQAYAEVPDWADNEDWRAEMVLVRELFKGRVRQGFDYDILATEVPFKIRVGTMRAVRNAGKMDKVVRMHDGRVAMCEIKTTQDDITPGVADYWSKLRLDSQISRYLSAAKMVGFPEAETVVYDVTRKPSIKRKNIAKKDYLAIIETGQYCGIHVLPEDSGIVHRAVREHVLSEADLPKSKQTVAKIRETPELYGMRLRSLIDEDPGRYYQTLEIPRLQADLDSMNERLVEDVKEIRLRRKHNLWQRNENACTAMGRCPFLDLCSNHVDTSNGTIPDGFKKLSFPHPELNA